MDADRRWRLDGRTALVTGASGSLGRVVCATLRARGAAVVGADIAGAADVVCDAGTDEGARAMVDFTLDRHGRLDVLVLNAGAQHVAPIAEFPAGEWGRLNDVMVKGPFLTLKRAWPELIARPGSRVIVTASTSSFGAEPYKVAYVSAKHAVLGLVKVAAKEGAPHGLTVNAVAPSWMRTPMVEQQLEERMRLYSLSRDEALAALVSEHPVKRFVEPQEVADVMAFLAAPAASAVNGACVAVDLGAMA